MSDARSDIGAERREEGKRYGSSDQSDGRESESDEFEITIGETYYHLELGEVIPIALTKGVVGGTIKSDERVQFAPIVIYEIVNRAKNAVTTHADVASSFDNQTEAIPE